MKKNKMYKIGHAIANRIVDIDPNVVFTLLESDDCSNVTPAVPEIMDMSADMPNNNSNTTIKLNIFELFSGNFLLFVYPKYSR
jgi:hypothetical protein